MSISALDKKQWVSVLKAMVYAFVSAFAVSMSATGELSKAAFLAAGVAGFNACLVVIKKLLTPVVE